MFNNLPVKFFKVTVINEVTPSELKNGTIYKIENNKIYIKTSSGAIIPEIIQYAGLFVGDSNDLINHVKVKVGDKFGNG
jgi:methionyl-tRNA formyltransferase